MLFLVVWLWEWGIGTGLKSRISSGTDIVSLTLRKRTGKDVGSLSLMVNGAILAFAGIFIWLAVRPLFYGLYLCIKSCYGCHFTKQRKCRQLLLPTIQACDSYDP